jgi:carbonic anhydrase
VPTPKILAGIQRFQEHVAENREMFDRLATQGQSPQVLFIACSDSRVSPEIITDAEVGELLVARTLGNIIPPFGTGQMGVGAVIEYAVIHMVVEHIVLCGHTDCAGIKALDAPPDWSHASHIARWIEHARPAKTKVDASGQPAGDHHLAVVRENVLLQLEHLRSYDPVREGERAGTLKLHGCVYRLETGTFEAFDQATVGWLPVARAG